MRSICGGVALLIIITFSAVGNVSNRDFVTPRTHFADFRFLPLCGAKWIAMALLLRSCRSLLVAPAGRHPVNAEKRTQLTAFNGIKWILLDIILNRTNGWTIRGCLQRMALKLNSISGPRRSLISAAKETREGINHATRWQLNCPAGRNGIELKNNNGFIEKISRRNGKLSGWLTKKIISIAYWIIHIEGSNTRTKRLL